MTQWYRKMICFRGAQVCVDQGDVPPPHTKHKDKILSLTLKSTLEGATAFLDISKHAAIVTACQTTTLKNSPKIPGPFLHQRCWPSYRCMLLSDLSAINALDVELHGNSSLPHTHTHTWSGAHALFQKILSAADNVF